jgi:hypothetical protein
MEEEMGALLGSSALLLGALQAQQKLTKKGPSRALFVLKPKSLGQPVTRRCQRRLQLSTLSNLCDSRPWLQ